MKKLFLLIAFAGLALFASAQVTNLTSFGDTVTNTETENLTITLPAPAQTATFQVGYTKLSGTVSGSAKLYGSLDGTYYTLITTAADSLAVTNTTTQSKLWVVTGSPYIYYKIACTGIGTSAARVYGKALLRK